MYEQSILVAYFQDIPAFNDPFYDEYQLAPGLAILYSALRINSRALKLFLNGSNTLHIRSRNFLDRC
jgi:hypothetical protein